MNPITTEPKQQDKVTDVRQVQQEIKKEHIGSIRPKRGHKLYEINLVEKTIELATFKEQAVYFNSRAKKLTSKGLGLMTSESGTKKIVLDGLPDVKKILNRKDNCIYISALNKKNVIKRLVKRGIVKLK